MPKLSIKQMAQPRYLVPVAGWVGCVFVLKFMVTGMAGHGLIRPAGPEDARMAILERSDTAGDTEARTAAAEPARTQPATTAAAADLPEPELARQDGPDAPI